MKTRILLVEDDKSLGRVVKDYLVLSGFEVTICEDGLSALQVFRRQPFDICLVDVMLPQMDGITFVETIRNEHHTTPVLFITSKAAKEDRIRGFLKGGDDYISKPFDIEELILRIKVFLKRTSRATNPVLYRFGRSEFDPVNFELRVNGGKRKLTDKEARILQVLCSGLQRVVTREEILKTVWGKDDYFLGRSLDVYISRLRKYLADDPATEIENHHGIGFKLSALDPP